MENSKDLQDKQIRVADIHEQGDRVMVILLYTLGFAVALVLTRSYGFLDKFYTTALYVSCMSLLFQLMCRSHLLWRFSDWGFFTDKLSVLTQFVLLFPMTVILFLRYLPSGFGKAVPYYLGFVGLYVLLEYLLTLRHEIIYQYGWSFGWSVFIDFCLFALTWLHAKSWKAALPVSTCIIVVLMVWFRVPLQG